MQHNQPLLNQYFGITWKQRNRSLDQYQFSGWELIKKVKPTESVIDIGCGDNPFKGKIKHLIGFDPAFPEADYQVTLEEFVTTHKTSFDVAFCLGSINFGNIENIERQIGLVVGLLKGNGRIYWRSNPGSQDHGNTECEDIEFYPWSIAEHVRLADMFGFTLVECRWDRKNRIYAEWRRRPGTA